VFAAVFTAILVASLRGQRRMTEAQALVARGHLEAAALACRQLLRSWLPLIAGHGAMWLSELLARDGEWEECLAVADRAIARLRAADATRVAASDLLLPALHARRASALQALGRVHEAHAELALLYEQFPAFPGLPVTHHRVALFRAARRGDLAEVARLADLAGDDLGISVREELLADVARAVCRTGATSAAEVERLRAELRDDPASQRWLVKVCPSLLSGFEVTYGDADGTTSQCSGAVDPGVDEVEAAHEGERELRAELEATEATVPRRARG
jgi:hypothetical protein